MKCYFFPCLHRSSYQRELRVRRWPCSRACWRWRATRSAPGMCWRQCRRAVTYTPPSSTSLTSAPSAKSKCASARYGTVASNPMVVFEPSFGSDTQTTAVRCGILVQVRENCWPFTLYIIALHQKGIYDQKILKYYRKCWGWPNERELCMSIIILISLQLHLSECVYMCD